MGGLVCTAYVGQEQRPPVDAFIGASCQALIIGSGLGTLPVAALEVLAGGDLKLAPGQKPDVRRVLEDLSR